MHKQYPKGLTYRELHKSCSAHKQPKSVTCICLSTTACRLIAHNLQRMLNMQLSTWQHVAEVAEEVRMMTCGLKLLIDEMRILRIKLRG